MYALESIQNTIEYIEEHISEEIEVDELAKIAHLSPFYYQRLFKRLVNKSVMEYIKLRRLARSVELLEDKGNRIIDVALTYGFNDHAIYTKTFKRFYGITPYDYRLNPVILNHFYKPELLHNYIIIEEGQPLLFEEMILEIERKQVDLEKLYVGYSKQINIKNQLPLGEKTGVDEPALLWKKFHQEKYSIDVLKPNGVEIGVSEFIENSEKFNYFVGGEAIEINDSFDNWALTKGAYIVCKFEAENFEILVSEALIKAHNYLFNIWLINKKINVLPYAVEMYSKKDGFPYVEICVKIL